MSRTKHDLSVWNKRLIDTCQHCSTSRANQALRSLANAGFQNRGVCLQAFPSFPSPSPSLTFWLSFHFSRGQNRKSPSLVFLCAKTKRKRLLRRLGFICHSSATRYQTLVSSLPRKTVFRHRRPKTEFMTRLAGQPSEEASHDVRATRIITPQFSWRYWELLQVRACLLITFAD